MESFQKIYAIKFLIKEEDKNEDIHKVFNEALSLVDYK